MDALGRRSAASVVVVLVLAACSDAGTSPLLTSAAPTSAAPTTAAPTSSGATTSVATTVTTSIPPLPTSSPTGPTSTSPVGPVDPLALLLTISVDAEHAGGYDPSVFGVWSDLDGDGCDTREEVLEAESRTPVRRGPTGCTVAAGEWLSPYDGLVLTDPADAVIDHVVSLREAWESGAWGWASDRLVAFGNDLGDPRTLVVVSAAADRAKGDADPVDWLPQDRDVCRFVLDWVAIKARWDLSMDPREWGRIQNLLRGPCVGNTLDTEPGT